MHQTARLFHFSCSIKTKIIGNREILPSESRIFIVSKKGITSLDKHDYVTIAIFHQFKFEFDPRNPIPFFNICTLSICIEKQNKNTPFVG